MMKKRLIYWALCLILVAAMVAAAVLYYGRVRRVSRQHADHVPPKLEYLAKRIDYKWRGNTQLGQKDVERDLDELEWLFENRFSYLKRRPVDYQSALDCIRSSLGRGISRAELAVQLQKVFCLFGDGHSMVASPTIKRMGGPYLPFLIADSKGRPVAFTSDRSAFLSPDHPYLVALDRVGLADWLALAKQTVAQGSKQLVRHACIRQLRNIGYLRKELSLPSTESLSVELESHDGHSRHRLNVQLTEEFPMYGCWPEGDVNAPIASTLEGDVGYLRIAPFMSHEPEYQEGLIEGMETLRNTRGLVIDVRGNGGGSRAPLRTLFPFFLAPNAKPKVLNVAAYRLGHKQDILAARWLYPVDWKGWSNAERDVIAQLAQTFTPEWELPAEQFSEWHYFVIGPSTAPGYYHYSEPVVVLMDSVNFSAADIFLGAFKGHPNITLMGPPSSGGSGRTRQTWLANSRVCVYLSSMASFRPNGLLYEGRGIQPDIVMEPEPGYLIGQSDATLQAAIRVLGAK
jgi:hypothetical protein